MFKIVNGDRFAALGKRYHAIFFKKTNQLMLCEARNDDLKDVNQVSDFCKYQAETLASDQTLYFWNDSNNIGMAVAISDADGIMPFFRSLYTEP